MDCRVEQGLPTVKTSSSRKHSYIACLCNFKSFDIHAAIESSEASIDVHLRSCLLNESIEVTMTFVFSTFLLMLCPLLSSVTSCGKADDSMVRFLLGFLSRKDLEHLRLLKASRACW